MEGGWPGSTAGGSPTEGVTACCRGGALEYGGVASLGWSLAAAQLAAGIKEGALLDRKAMGSVMSISLMV